MPSGDKSKYTEKQKRQAKHIEEGYESRSVPRKEAERRAWGTVNKRTGGGKLPGGSGREKSTERTSSQQPSRSQSAQGSSIKSSRTRLTAGSKSGSPRSRTQGR